MPGDPEIETTAGSPVEEPVPPEVSDGHDALRLEPRERSPLLAQMWAALFRHLSTLGAGAIAGLLVLLEVQVVSGTGPFWVATACLALGTLVAFGGSIAVVELVEEGGGSTKKLKGILAACACLFGLATGVAVIEILMG